MHTVLESYKLLELFKPPARELRIIDYDFFVKCYLT